MAIKINPKPGPEPEPPTPPLPEEKTASQIPDKEAKLDQKKDVKKDDK
jgi:hypothetical protein